MPGAKGRPVGEANPASLQQRTAKLEQDAATLRLQARRLAELAESHAIDAKALREDLQRVGL